jgi:flagellar basal body-associated protein FliL
MVQEQSTPDENPQAQEQAPAAAAKPSLFGKIKILLFVAVVIAVECIVAYWYLPKTAETAALAGSAVDNKTENKTKDKQDAENELNRQLEVNLGEFNVTAYQPASNTTLRIDFHLYGTVAASDQKLFMSRLEENQYRFREQVIEIVRGSEITDLTDAGLGLVKRKLMDKTNRMLGKQLLQTVIFSDFSFIEQ